MMNPNPFQLLEINVISAQDLAPVSKSMRTYAIVWVHSERKLTTRIDQTGNTNPQWNEKFVFRVDDTFLNSDTSAIMIEIYAAAWLRDVQIGSVRVLISNLFPSAPTNNSKMRFVALQIRRPSGRPQGILNMGVQLLDSTMRSMPLYTELSASAVGFNDLIDAKANTKHTMEEKTAQLRRTRSEHTDLNSADEFGVKGNNGLGGGLSGMPRCSAVNAGSLLSSYTMDTRSSREKEKERERDYCPIDNGRPSMVSELGPSASVVAAAIAKGLIKTPANAPTPPQKSDGSSILEDWTESDSAEGLRTKLERWRTELPPIYDSDAKKMKSRSRRSKLRRGRSTSNPGLFTCFGNVFGCEISISCGGGSSRKYEGQVCRLSSRDSQSYL
ncbi:Calcium-dependent lipid-binding (CaLB domain) family protein [Euphorbia peplus]|nr:Calcium-dependent lipid-binding (CaLB domain) family protein [Euphorbia peplus]